MPFGGLFGAADRNNQKRKAEDAAYERAKEAWEKQEEIRQNEYDYQLGQHEAAIESQEANLKFQELTLRDSYQFEVAQNIAEYDAAKRAYDASVERATNQLSFNEMAENVARNEQQQKVRDDLLGIMFEKSDMLLEHQAKTTGLAMTKSTELRDQNFRAAEVNAKFNSDLGNLRIERRQTRAKAQQDTQNTILAGLKAAGELRAKGSSGRSSAKTVLGVMAESGAARAAIANGLMYAEDSIDLGIAQLRDMLILDQTKVLAAQMDANNKFTLEQSSLDATKSMGLMKADKAELSIKIRDQIVRDKISNARAQADLNAENMIMMQPERLPIPSDPSILYAQFDDPETEDYVEILTRPFTPDFPEFVPMPKPSKDEFKYMLGRENVGLSNFGDALGLAGSIAGGIGAIAPFGMTAASAGTFTQIGRGLQLSSNFFR